MEIETADQIRQRLRNERNAHTDQSNNEQSTGSVNPISVSSSSRDTIEYSPDFGSQDQRDQRPVQGLHNGIRSTKRTTGDTQRKLDILTGSLAQVNQRKRSADRRPSQDNSQDRPDGIDVPASVAGRTERARTVGNLETFDAIPPRTFNAEATPNVKEPEVTGDARPRKRGRPPKRRDPSIEQLKEEYTILPEKSGVNVVEGVKNFISGGSVLSEREAKALKEPLIAALQDEFQMVDKLIWSYTEDPLEQPIWSDLTEKEIESFTNLFLKMGQRVPVVATAARTAVDGADYVTTAMILAPRFQNTVSVVREARKKKVQNARTQPRQSTIERFRRNRNQTPINSTQ